MIHEFNEQRKKRIMQQASSRGLKSRRNMKGSLLVYFENLIELFPKSAIKVINS